MRAFSGFLLAGTVGLGLGLVMSQWRVARQVLSGPLELLRPISSIAWLPLTILWFGIGFASIVAVIFISCVFIILLNTLAAAMRVEPDLVKAALTLGAGRRAVFWKVVIPSALPGILLGLRIALSGAWGGVLIAELIAAREGLGFMIGRAEASFHPELVIGGMVVIGVVGYLLNALFLLLQRRYIHGHT
jgi:ABC-type nitrate/sulfonate/bicarbonate transport system permease component